MDIKNLLNENIKKLRSCSSSKNLVDCNKKYEYEDYLETYKEVFKVY